MKERKPDFLGFFPTSGISLILCIELLMPICELRLAGVTFSENLLPAASCLSFSVPPSDFRVKGRFVDSESARGLFTAITSSETELTAISFCRAAIKCETNF